MFYKQNFFAFHPILMKLGSCFSGCSQISTTLVDPKKQIIHKKDLWISYFFYNVHCSKTEKSAILGGHTGYLKGFNQCFLIIFRIKHICRVKIKFQKSWFWLLHSYTHLYLLPYFSIFSSMWFFYVVCHAYCIFQ